MQITDEQLTQFKQIYREHFGYDLTSAEARERGMSLLRVVRFAYQPITQAEVDALEWHTQQKLTQEVT
jgi:hypothetical protein